MYTAIYDYDGMTTREIGKAYDWDGTTSHQLGKGYDWDGTTSHLIYSATPEYLYNSGDQITDFTGGWAISRNIMTHTASWNGVNNGRAVIGSDYLEVGMNSTSTSGQYNGSGLVTKNKIDFSDINKLTFNLSINYGVEQYDYWAIALVNELGGTINKSWILDCRNYGTTFSLDTTNFNGSYKLYVGVYTSDGRWGQKRITSIKVN